ncbi:hypothetical protein [Streptomyces paromomycinus]|uniref:Uncharacterized protein n=1 Tax=Streptomyces paromomycinus TaxID=92743 RepID=A0A401WCW8_STREY|nr:hypothetical protein [Streptomyces paromomycinus]GCD47157.1 hypothetical protein GKJPGBOP_06915 [Streptomyces paromomycinus]
MTWSEADHLDCLQAERRGYAYVMRQHGGLTSSAARETALERYPYEPDGDPYRGLVFHDEAWHWAMLAIHGDRYAADHPGPAHPSVAYRALAEHAGRPVNGP